MTEQNQTPDIDDTEGHGYKREDDDTEGHARWRADEEEEDTEGHARWRADEEEETPRATPARARTRRRTTPRATPAGSEDLRRGGDEGADTEPVRPPRRVEAVITWRPSAMGRSWLEPRRARSIVP